MGSNGKDFISKGLASFEGISTLLYLLENLRKGRTNNGGGN